MALIFLFIFSKFLKLSKMVYTLTWVIQRKESEKAASKDGRNTGFLSEMELAIVIGRAVDP
jgi:hypothetical protein